MKLFTYAFLGLIGLVTLATTTDAQAYWHGYRGGLYGPGWGGGCWRCGPGWVGPGPGVEVVEGATAPPVIVEQAPAPVYVQQPSPVVQAPASVYVQQPGQPVVVAPAPGTPVVGYSIPPIGATFPNLLPGCFLAPRNGINFYQCQGFRLRPLYGGNNFYYRVVPG
jgi:hypothetical protein